MKKSLAVIASLAGILIAGTILVWRGHDHQRVIKIGILHSRTGAMAISESSMIDAELLAIKEINARGGILGKKVVPVIADGQSDWPTFAREAERLISREQVTTIFGCWTSASRKHVKTVVEKHNHLLVYPMAYEGLEQSPNIIYTGAAPNQQIIPALKWSCDNLGRRYFLVGSDYVWPHSVNAIIKDQLKALGGELAGEEYIYFGSSDFDKVVERIKQARPDVIFSAVVGDSNIAFYKSLVAAGIRPEKTPVISVSIGEDELRKLPVQDIVGNFAAWNYFQSIGRPENISFVERFKQEYGADRVTSDVIEAAYFSVHLWAQAVDECESDDVQRIRKAMLGQSLNAPEGVVSVDPETQHTWRSVSIGKIRRDGQIDLVWTSQKAIRPVPFPISRTRSDWEQFLEDMYNRWGGKWANPEKVN
jgi:urea transport system substrate-binding protein